MKKKAALDRLREISKQRPIRGANSAARSLDRGHGFDQTNDFAADKSRFYLEPAAIKDARAAGTPFFCPGARSPMFMVQIFSIHDLGAPCAAAPSERI